MKTHYKGYVYIQLEKLQLLAKSNLFDNVGKFSG